MQQHEEVLEKLTEIPTIVSFLGKLGSGKGTQSAMFLNFYESTFHKKLLYIESGNLFREHIPKFNSFNREKASVIKNEGKFHHWLTTAILWGNVFLFQEHEGSIVFDNSPSDVGEAQAFIEYFQKYHGMRLIFLHIDVPDDVAINRAKVRNGTQDRPETKTDAAIQNKLAYFNTETVEALKMLRLNPEVAVKDIDGNAPDPTLVFPKVITALTECLV